MSNIESTTHQAPATSEATPAASGQAAAPTPTTSGFEEWIKGFEKYESMLGDVAKISLNPKYKEELGTVEQWYKVLTPSERTATVYHLIQTSTQDQLRFFGSTIQRLARLEDTPAPTSATLDGKPKLAKLSMRPPSLNLPSLGSPSTPTPLTATKEVPAEAPSNGLNLEDPSTWTNSTNAGNTPLLPLFQKEGAADGGNSAAPGLSMMNPYTLNMLANAGLSPEAQLLAVQLIMSGLVQPTGAPGAAAQKALKKTGVVPGTATWRTPTSARYPGSALRTGPGLRASALKSAGLGALKSAGLDSPSVDSPKPEDFKPEMLEDIPGWLRSLRLHKYTSCFEGMPWQEMVCLDDAGLEAKGVSALGARRRLLRTFEHARKTMGIEEPADSVTPTSTVNTQLPKLPEVSTPAAPHSAVPITRSKLSITSPVFTPTWETASNGASSATPEVSVTSPPTSAAEAVDSKA